MDIVPEGTVPIEEAFAWLRNAPLEETDGQEICLYKDARIVLAHFFPEELNLTSLYIVKEKLEFQRRLRKHLLGYGIDTLNLSEVIHLRTPEGIMAMAPPFTETYEERVIIVPKDGDRDPPEGRFVQLRVLKDGIHRATLARELGLQIRCIAVSSADPAHLPYAYPNSWDEVGVYDSVPAVKKFYRRQNPYSFMRPIKVLRQVGDKPPAAEYGRK